ncbi:MAG: PH domain-containing protein [Phycisphaerae bacterium]|jgi:hypothetical protein
MNAARPPDTLRLLTRDGAAALDEVRGARIELIRDDEIIQLLVKPSLWYIAIAAARFVAAVGILAAIAGMVSDGFTLRAPTIIFLLLVGAGAARIGIATLQWASRLYVLTNRRALRFRGVLAIEVSECLLGRIEKAELRRTALQRMLGLGSIVLLPLAPATQTVVWDHVRRPTEIHEAVSRAIEKARGAH